MGPELSRRNLASGLSLALVVGLLVALALNSDGHSRDEVSLNDASVWVTNRDDAMMARLNSQIGRLDQGLTVPDAAAFDVEQHRDTVLLNAASRVDIIDVASVEPSASVSVPEAAEVGLGEETVSILDPADGSVWVTSADELGTYSTDDDPSIEAGAGAQAVVTDADDVIVLDVEGAVHRIDGVSRESEHLGDLPAGTDGSLQLTAVGHRAVVLDVGQGLVLQPDAEPIAVPGMDVDSRIQHPGPESSTVALATATASVTVPLDGGDPQIEEFGGDGAPAAPLSLDGCVHRAWADPDAESYLMSCEDAADVRQPIGEVAAGGELRFRHNRDVVVINDLLSGDVWMPQDQMRLVDNWDDINEESEPEFTDTVEIDDPETQDENRRPVLQPDFLGARPDRDTILRVLANDSDPDGDLLTITGVQMESGAAEYADAIQIVGDDTELQLSLEAEASGEIRFSYTASDGRPGGEASADVVVEVREPERNEPPEMMHGPSETTVAAGRSVSAYVLPDWEDPDGDELFVEGARAPDGGSVSFRPDGLVTYTDEGDEARGTVEVEVDVNDGRETTTGTLEVEVLPPGPQPPDAVPDHVSATVGRPQPISPLLNDVSVDGEDLVLSSVTPSTRSSLGGAGVPELEADESAGTFTFEAPAEGTYFVDYTVRTSGEASTSTVRVDVSPPREDNRAPIAVKDRADVPLGGQALVVVLANDSDPDGDLLAISSVEIPDDLPVKVGVVDRQLLRIEAPVDITEQVEAGEARITYTVTDGQDSASAEVTLNQFAPSDDNRAPIAADDDVTVRSGDIATVRVLDNDRDPDGDPLTLVPDGLTSQHDELEVVFVAGDTVRIEGPDVSEPRRFLADYEVTDPYGRSSTATIRIDVTPEDEASNRAPVPRSIEGRVIAGSTTRIPIPTDGIDPDGDSVRFLGLVEGPSLGYVADSGPGWIEYVAYSTDEGGGGVDSFAVELSDRYGAAAVAPVDVVVSPRAAENHPPVAMDDYIQVRPGRTVHVDVLANDTDADNDTLTLVDGADTELGRSVISLEAPDGAGQVTERYSVWDGYGGIGSAVLTVEAAEDAPLHPPVAVDDVANPAQVAGQRPGDTITVDVLANDYDPDGSVDELRLDSDDATVSGGELRIELAESTRMVPYRITDADDLTSHGYVTVVGTDEVAPVIDPGKLDSDGRARVDVGETLEIPLDEYVLVRYGHDAVLPDEGLLQASVGDLEARVDDATVVFKTAGVDPGVVTLTIEVADDGDPALSSVIALPIAVQNPDNVAPVVDPLTIDLAVRDTEGILLTPEAYIADPDARDEPRCRFSWTEGVIVQQQGSGCGVIVRPGDGVSPPAEAVIDVEVIDDQGDTGEGEITVNLVERIDLTNRVRFPDFVAEQGRELRVDVDDYVTDDADRGELTVLAAGQHRVSGSEIVVQPTDVGGFTVPVTLRTPEGTTVSSSFRVDVGARPGAPGQPQVARSEAGAVQLRWSAPESNGYPIDAYFVEAEGVPTRECPPTPQCRITGLDADRDYTFRVAARNELGRGPLSPASSSVRPDQVPEQMSAPSVEVQSGSRVGVRLSWRAPTNRGSDITAYEIQRSDTGAVERVSAGSRSWTDTSVRAGGSYRYQIRAINGAPRPQEFSAWATAEPYGTPSAPGQPSLERTSGGTSQDYRVTWSGADARGAQVQDYQVRVSGRGATNVGRSTTTTVSGLRVGESYRIDVRARNRGGWGPWSPSAQVSPTAAPAAPPAPRVELVDADRARVSWSYSSGDFNAGGDRHFRIVDDDGRTLNARVGEGARDVTVSLSRPGDARRIRVVAVNSRGSANGSWSSPVTPVGEPSRPDMSRPDVSGSSVTFRWSGPRFRGGGNQRVQVYVECERRPFGDCDGDDYSGGLPLGEWTTVGSSSITLEARWDVRFRVSVRGVVADPGGGDIEGPADRAGWENVDAPDSGAGASTSGTDAREWIFAAQGHEGPERLVLF